MTCYTSLAIIARDLMSDQVPSASLVCRILSELHRLECHDSWRNRNVSFLTYDGWRWIAMHHWSAFLKIEGKQNSPTVIVPISKESSSHQHQPRKSKILQVFQKLQWSTFRTHHISHHVASCGAQLERKWAQQRLFQSPRVGWKNPWGNTLVGTKYNANLHWGNG